MDLNVMIEKYGLNKINSATKYPSILTYHELGLKGGMINELCEGKSFPANEKIEITEKVDGTNSRMVLVGNDFLIGSREEIVYAREDRIKNSVIIDPVVKALRKVVREADETDFNKDCVTVIFGESYGHKIQSGSKVYCAGSQKVGYRVFDIVKWTQDEFINIMDSIPADALASWRDRGSQKFLNTDGLSEFCDKFSIDRTPIIYAGYGKDIPTDVEETLNWMGDTITFSKAVLDTAGSDDLSNPKFGRPEGLVIRTPDRSLIRKLRFEDYNKGKKKGWK